MTLQSIYNRVKDALSTSHKSLLICAIKRTTAFAASLFIGLAATLSLTSCENKALDDPSIEDAALREYYYTQAFESMFGSIDPSQDWGFGLNTNMSRATNTNGNEWETWPSVTYDEILIVYAYLMSSNPTYLTENPIFTNFYLTHVLSSHDYYLTPANWILNSSTSEKDGSGQMDYLSVGETLQAKNGFSYEIDQNTASSIGWYHANNFNASSNNNFDGNTLFYKSGTYDFAYKNSLWGTYYRKYKIISGKDVLAWAKNVDWSDINDIKSRFRDMSHEYRKYKTWDDLATYTNWKDNQTITFKNEFTNVDLDKLPEKFSEYYYICFDYESYCNQTITKFRNIKINNDASKIDVTVPGLYKTFGDALMYLSSFSEEDWNTLIAKDDEYNTLGYQNLKNNFSSIDDGQTDVSPSEMTNGDKQVLPDDFYTDWVVRLIGPALRQAEYVNRVIVEDLSVSANLTLSNNNSDWDFNDLVMDINITSNASDGKDEAEVTIRALGGTLPIYIGYLENASDEESSRKYTDELHSIMGVSQSDMINTGLHDGITPQTFYLLGNFTTNNVADPNKVGVFINTNGSYTEMKAERGKAPSKIRVDGSFNWMREYVHILSAYPKFSDWVQDSSITDWYFDTEYDPDTVIDSSEGQ